MAQYVLTIKKATVEKCLKSQDIMMSDENKSNKCLKSTGNQQIANPDTIAMAIFNTFRSLCRRAQLQRWPIARLESSAT